MVNLPFDAFQRLNRLQELSEDFSIINEDGTSIKPLSDFTAEVLGKSRKQVTQADRDLVTASLSILHGNQRKYGSPFNKSSN